MTDGRNRDLAYYRCVDCKLWNYDLEQGLDQGQYTEVYVSPTDEDYKQNRIVTPSWHYLHARFPEPGKILDIGCGNGRLLYLARENGWEVKGLELSASAAASITAEQDIDVVVANFLEHPTDALGTYDIVVLRHILEHLPQPITAMNQIRSLLKPGGHALLEFPNTASAGYAYKRFLKNRGLKNNKYSAEWRPGHANEYCRDAFSLLLDKTGFELVDWQTYSSKSFMNAFYRLVPVASKARALIRAQASH
ncbi:MAG: class I SAM-dependent methyltransferase [Gammaproteobacteria bacterium]|nr:class I SAM-dependent methyltransferase [Gammaproteobacteria bacterium]